MELRYQSRGWLVFLLTLFATCSVLAKKGRKLSEKEMFGSKSLRCLVCRALKDEIEYRVGLVSPAKMIEKNVGGYRMGASGEGQQQKKKKTLVSRLVISQMIHRIT